MKNIRKLILGCIIIVMAVGILIYKYHLSNIDSNAYLSGNGESQKSFEVYDGNGEDSGNIKKFDFKKFDGRWSFMKFTSSKGNKINISDNTKIGAGRFYLVVLDSKYNIVAKKNETSDKGNIEFTTPRDGEYTIRIAGEKASGKFDISVNAKEKVDISHMDFWS
ncbi:hypothetical protein ACJDT4_01125 [Clostridium neuense]|uniref:Uncharacterized protein n=1 Tax=Clostridium neuense TaxID=1728934 RepID=A0ABW8T926_9CLOT